MRRRARADDWLGLLIRVADDDLYDAIVDASGQKIGNHHDAAYALDRVTVLFDRPSWFGAGEFFVQFVSFFIPPIGLIPGTVESCYDIKYRLVGPGDEVVGRGLLRGSVSGKWRGWYVGRTFVIRGQLRPKMGSFIVKDSAARLWNSVRAGRAEGGSPQDRHAERRRSGGAVTVEGADRRRLRGWAFGPAHGGG